MVIIFLIIVMMIIIVSSDIFEIEKFVGTYYDSTKFQQTTPVVGNIVPTSDENKTERIYINDAPSNDLHEQKMKVIEGQDISKDKQYTDVVYIKRDEVNYASAFTTELSPVSRQFFSDNNIEEILDKIRKSVYTYTEENFGKAIDVGKQDRKELIRIMEGKMTIAQQYLPTVITNEGITKQVKYLNNEVVDYLTPRISGAALSYVRYIRDISNPYELIDNPLYGKLSQKEMSYNSYYNNNNELTT